jgi:transposase-like protein
MPQGREFIRLAVGTVVAGCEVLEWKNEATKAAEQTYTVKFTCCKRTAVLTHKRVINRRSMGVEKCSRCGPRWAKGTKKTGTFPKRHPPEVRLEAIYLRGRGMSLMKISAKLGVSLWTIREWVKTSENNDVN